MGALAPKPPSHLTPADQRSQTLETQTKDALGRLHAVADRSTQEQNQIEKTVSGLQMPKLETPPQPTVKPTEPHQIWGSAAMTLAVLGSLFTRRPLVTAMNAASQVIQAYRKGDQEAANAAFKSWEVNTKNAIDLANYQMEQYKAILGHAEHLERLSADQASTQERAITAELVATARAFQDETMAKEAENRGVMAAAQLNMSRQRLTVSLEAQGPKLAENHAFAGALRQLQSSPDFQQADPGKQMEMIHDLREKIAPSHTLTAGQIATHEQQIKSGLEKGALGKSYSAAAQQLQTVRAFGQKYPNGASGAVAQAALADAFTQLVNGGRAIRGFQMKMNTEHAGLWDKAQIAAAQLGKGGPLSPRMIKDMEELAEQVAHERSSQYMEAISRERERAIRMGLDPNNIVPSDFDPSSLGELPQADPATIPADAVALLKKNPTPEMSAQFDSVFGKGAAAHALGH